MTFNTYLIKVFPTKNPFLRKEKGFICNFFKWLAIRIAYVFYKLHISANVLDIFGLSLSFFGFYFFMQIQHGQKILALLGIGMIFIHVFIDFIDGSIAKARETSSFIGNVLDDIGSDLDRFLLLIVLGYFTENPIFIISMVFSAFILIWIFPNTQKHLPNLKLLNFIKYFYLKNTLFLGVRFMLGTLLLFLAGCIVLNVPIQLISFYICMVYIILAIIWMLVLLPEYNSTETKETL